MFVLYRWVSVSLNVQYFSLVQKLKLCRASKPLLWFGYTWVAVFALPPPLLCAPSEPRALDPETEGGMHSTLGRCSKSERSAPPTSTRLLPLLGLLVLSCFTTLAAGQRAPAPTPAPAASRSSGETPAPRGAGDGGGRVGSDDDDGDLSEVCDADGGSADYSEVLT